MESQIAIQAKALQDQLVAWRREFHQCPELKMDTPITSGKIENILRHIGITDIRTHVGGNGVCCVIHGKYPGKCLGIRADCDGLPIKEETGLPFASTNGNMHACGHDAHTSMALGAAKLIFEHRNELKGKVKMIFQPFEEGDGGAKAMIADGVLENPYVDALIALHTGNLMGNNFQSGDICYHPEYSSFATRSFWVNFKGRSCHVCAPQLGVDPVMAACTAVMQLQVLITKEREPSQPGIVSVQMIHGGARNNMIPDECRIDGSIRSTSKYMQDYYFQRVNEICTAVANGMRCTVEIGCPFNLMPTVNDNTMVEKFLTVAPKIVPEENIKQIHNLQPIGEDFARFADVRPSIYFFHCSSLKNVENYPHHSNKFNIDESTLWSGTGIFAQFALDWQK